MKYFEFGTEHPELMVILHGGLAGEHPDRFAGEVRMAYEASCRS